MLRLPKQNISKALTGKSIWTKPSDINLNPTKLEDVEKTRQERPHIL